MNPSADNALMPMPKKSSNNYAVSAGEVVLILKGRLFGSSENIITEPLTDSRSVTYGPGGVFFAIKGPNHDGHLFIHRLYAMGIRVFVVEKVPEDISAYPDASFIEVTNSVRALQQLTAHKRSSFRGVVFAITGSAGKTIVKEWLSEILGCCRRVVRSPKSYNSQTGVPLSVWRVSDKFDTGVFEAGISQPGEMIHLEPVIRPDIGIFTNIGDAHQENFHDTVSKIREKLVLFTGVKHLIYPADSETIHKEVLELFGTESTVPKGWSFNNSRSPFYCKMISQLNDQTELLVTWESGSLTYSIPFDDRASVDNSVSVVVASVIAGISPEIISREMPGLIPVAMRMSVRNGINNCLLIEDYYNSDPGSLAMAIDYLSSKQGRSRTLILSDFLQTGRDQEELARDVAGMVGRGKISRFIGIGESLYKYREHFGEGSEFFRNTGDFIASFSSISFRNESILLKGARLYQFELIANLLEQKSHTTVLEVNLDAIVRNLNYFRSLTRPGVRIMGMVKAFAYGSGGAAIGSLLEFNGVDYLGVAYADEGVDLREAGVTIPVMVMSPDPDSFAAIVKHNLEPELYSLRLFTEFSAYASRHGLIGYPVHIKVDTGMHRLGFLPEEISTLTKKLESDSSLRVVSVFSHLSASESPLHDDFTHNQARVFDIACNEIAGGLGYMPIRHLLNSAGISRFSEYQYEMVRPGLGLYGLSMAGGTNLSQVSRFTSRISQIKKVRAGEPVGYGYTSFADHDRLIAVIPVGYADGLKRQMGNGAGSVWIGGERAPLAGNICMDMCMADITDINAKENDRVEIFGENISLLELASACNTIPYEIIASIPPRVRRLFYHEQV